MEQIGKGLPVQGIRNRRKAVRSGVWMRRADDSHAPPVSAEGTPLLTINKVEIKGREIILKPGIIINNLRFYGDPAYGVLVGAISISYPKW